jgi:hypothetical protein
LKKIQNTNFYNLIKIYCSIVDAFTTKRSCSKCIQDLASEEFFCRRNRHVLAKKGYTMTKYLTNRGISKIEVKRDSYLLEGLNIELIK